MQLYRKLRLFALTFAISLLGATSVSALTLQDLFDGTPAGQTQGNTTFDNFSFTSNTGSVTPMASNISVTFSTDPTRGETIRFDATDFILASLANSTIDYKFSFDVVESARDTFRSFLNMISFDRGDTNGKGNIDILATMTTLPYPVQSVGTSVGVGGTFLDIQSLSPVLAANSKEAVEMHITLSNPTGEPNVKLNAWSFSLVPEPSSAAIFALNFAVLGTYLRRRTERKSHA